jgi:hemoglobin-like flavoprotein
VRQEQVELIRRSFETVLHAGDQASLAFYNRFFELAPETRSLFKDDIAEQGRLLIAALARIVTGLSHQQDVLPTLRELAVRYVAYGARAEHYPMVGDALLWMIDRMSSPEVDMPTREAWRAAYDLVAEAMIEAAYRSAEHD